MKAEPHRFQHEPFGEVEPIPFRARFSLDEFQRIAEGLTPAAMEDKWFIYFREPSLCLHRSWTGKAVYRVDFDVDKDGATVRDGRLRQRRRLPNESAGLHDRQSSAKAR